MPDNDIAPPSIGKVRLKQPDSLGKLYNRGTHSFEPMEVIKPGA